MPTTHPKATMSPCNECPFRKKSLPGYVGGHSDIMEITDIVQSDVPFPCHMQVTALREHIMDTEDESSDVAHEAALAEAKHCVGALMYMNATGKCSRDPTIQALQKKAGKSDEVFGSIPEMLTYHKSKRWAEHVKKMPKHQRDAINKFLREKKKETADATPQVDPPRRRAKTVRKPVVRQKRR